MHEAPVLRTLLTAAIDTATRHDASRITALHINLGASDHMSPDSARAHFVTMSAGTIAEGADLIVTISEAKVMCWDCSRETLLLLDQEPRCGGCGSSKVQPIPPQAGIASIDVE